MPFEPQPRYGDSCESGPKQLLTMLSRFPHELSQPLPW
jgi:hypothetical protein